MVELLPVAILLPPSGLLDLTGWTKLAMMDTALAIMNGCLINYKPRINRLDAVHMTTAL